jgi:hypothetical protein
MDSSYSGYGAEDAAAETNGVEFAPSRKGNAKRADDVWRSYHQSHQQLVPEAHSRGHARRVLVEDLKIRHRLCTGQGVHLATRVI